MFWKATLAEEVKVERDGIPPIFKEITPKIKTVPLQWSSTIIHFVLFSSLKSLRHLATVVKSWKNIYTLPQECSLEYDTIHHIQVEKN